MHSSVELTNLRLATDIGTYGPNDVVPLAHILDLTLTIDPGLVLIDTDHMASVFDYDPLIATITNLAADGHYETQERLITRIVSACADEPAVRALEIYLRKSPVVDNSGALGIRLAIDSAELDKHRR
ncbi:dihydroneopterin aldolase [Alphaproteobacteria bacterium]|nr:dihydroneopterin aldolase [Alphaproteobacteria bacterium]